MKTNEREGRIQKNEEKKNKTRFCSTAKHIFDILSFFVLPFSNLTKITKGHPHITRQCWQKEISKKKRLCKGKWKRKNNRYWYTFAITAQERQKKGKHLTGFARRFFDAHIVEMAKKGVGAVHTGHVSPSMENRQESRGKVWILILSFGPLANGEGPLFLWHGE